MRMLLAWLAMSAAHVLAAAPKADFHVDTGGADANPGTIAKPFATLTRARDAVRRRIATGLKGDVTVLIHGGAYFLSEPLVFGPEDSPAERQAITYAAAPGQEVVVSGGRRIAGWKRGRGELWTADVPGVKAGKWYPRHLFVNGRRAVRARRPNLGGNRPYLRLAGAKLSTDRTVYTLTVEPGGIRGWSNPSDVEIVVLGEWEIVRKRLKSVDADRHTVTLAPPHIENHRAILPRRGMACYFENAPELLDRPSEWYLDRPTGVLAYWPRPGEDMRRAEVVAPVLTRLVELRGTADRPIRNVHFRGIRFEHTDWPLPKLGHFGAQACARNIVNWADLVRRWDPASRRQVEPAIQWQFAHGCSLTDGAVAHTGGSGIWLRKGCRDARVEGNAVFDVAGNGVMVGEMWNFLYYRDASYAPKPADVSLRCRIANNHIHHCGVAFHGAVGVWLAFTDTAVVSHNDLHDLPYTGISVGWMWREKPNTVCRRNVIEHNHVHDVMRLLADGGCIYTLGRQDGTVLRGNLLHDVHYSGTALQNRRANNGIFFDQGSMGFRVEGNVIYNTAGPPLRFNQCRREWHTWKDNHFLPAARKAVPAAGLEPAYRKRLLGRTRRR